MGSTVLVPSQNYPQSGSSKAKNIVRRLLPGYIKHIIKHILARLEVMKNRIMFAVGVQPLTQCLYARGKSVHHYYVEQFL